MCSVARPARTLSESLSSEDDRKRVGKHSFVPKDPPLHPLSSKREIDHGPAGGYPQKGMKQISKLPYSRHVGLFLSFLEKKISFLCLIV
jgi:hypothetical protein